MTVDPLLADVGWPVAGAALAGALIGIERELRGHPAGLRTHTVVCLISALLLAATRHAGAASSPDPGRVAQGLLTGIGFLCGGVIVRQGLSVHGISTAASLWAVSGVGILFGAGEMELAAIGTAATFAVLVGFRWIDQALPERMLIDLAVAYRREGEFPEAGFRTLLAELGLHPRAVRQRLSPSGAIELGATLRGSRRFQTHELAQRLSDDPRVLSFHITPAISEP